MDENQDWLKEKEKAYLKLNEHIRSVCLKNKLNTQLPVALTDGIFETGAYGVPSKSQNSTILGQGGPSSTQCLNPSWA